MKKNLKSTARRTGSLFLLGLQDSLHRTFFLCGLVMSLVYLYGCWCDPRVIMGMWPLIALAGSSMAIGVLLYWRLRREEKKIEAETAELRRQHE